MSGRSRRRSRQIVMRVVVHCEGSREAGPTRGLSPAPGTSLLETELGPAHALARRAIISLSGATTHIEFDACDLDLMARRCESFRTFLDDLRTALRRQ